MRSKIKLMVLVLVASLCLAACSRDKEKAKQTVPQKPAETAKRQAEPPAPPPPPPPQILQVTGKVLEIIDTGSFLFVLLDWKGKQVWATIPAVVLKVGEVINLDQATMMEDFHSNTLGRTFDELIFASAVVGKAPRSRVAKGANPKDPRNRRSGKFMGVPSPAPPRPTRKVAEKVG